MIFGDVQLVNAGKHSEEKLKQNRYLMDYWENLRDIFCTFIPSKMDLVGISKVNIYLGKFDGEDYIEPSSDGIATFRRDDFEFSEFEKLSTQEQNEKSLYYIEDSLLKICEKFGVSSEVSNQIQEVAQEVLENNFELKRTYKKTTKWNKSRTLRAITILHHKVGGIDVEFSILNKKGEILASHKLMTDAIWNTVWFELFKGSWQDSTFVIENRVGNTAFDFTICV